MRKEIPTLQGRRILIVEDDYLIAQIVSALLEEAGADVVGPIGSVDEAISFIEGEGAALDGAILDVNLHGRKSYPVADVLAARDVAFIFATGYGADAVEGGYHRYPRCEKPFTQKALMTALTAALKDIDPPRRPASNSAAAG